MTGIKNQRSFQKQDPLAEDRLMERANIITAGAVFALNEEVFVFGLTPPLIFAG